MYDALIIYLFNVVNNNDISNIILYLLVELKFLPHSLSNKLGSSLFKVDIIKLSLHGIVECVSCK